MISQKLSNLDNLLANLEIKFLKLYEDWIKTKEAKLRSSLFKRLERKEKQIISIRKFIDIKCQK
jgi:hypothetical protein